MRTTAVVLAAGLGTRMRSAVPKALHPIAGRPMLRHLLATCETVFDRIVVVVGPGMEDVARAAAPHPIVVQAERLGTGHAALQAAGELDEGVAAVLFADSPLVRAETLRRLLDPVREGRAALSLMAMRPRDPGRYGRVITEDGQVRAVVEHADATEAQRAIGLCNGGAMAAEAPRMARWLAGLRAENAQKEYYLTDVVGQAAREDGRVEAVEAEEDELRGVNSRAELAAAEAVAQRFLREEALEAGVTLRAPETVFLSFDTRLAADTVVEPHVVFGPGVTVDGAATIRAFSHLEGCRVAAGAIVGPYARIRPGSVVGEGAHVGNFVELKATELGAGAKANHLAYLGDASVGAGSNIGAGSITCNYDGVSKHRTTIGERVFVGSDSVLVAPVTLGDGAFIAAGSVITEDVAPDALAFGRARQKSLPERGRMLRGGAG